MAEQGNVIERQEAKEDALAVLERGVRMLFVVTRSGAAVMEAERRAREDAAMDAEDILTQAEEANALDPVG